MTFMAWPEIEAFYNVRKYSAAHPEILNGTSKVSYKCKVKLHGTNAAVQSYEDGTIVTQSRTNIITPESDNAGFARWVMSNKDAWIMANGWIIYGEWCGSGIQKGVAISDIGKKVFAVFAARPLGESDKLLALDPLIVDPKMLQFLIQDIPDTYVLPWYGQSIDIDWGKSAEALSTDTAQINEWVNAVEVNDPWVEQIFNVKGTGEGLVFYPVSENHLGMENFKNLVFKAKGEKHKNIKTAAPAQVNPEVAASVDAFVELVLTPARLEQGSNAVGLDMKLTGKFVSWVLIDVQKETQDELEASSLEWKQVQKPLTDRARSWYIEQVKIR